jgi:hypothetical protein
VKESQGVSSMPAKQAPPKPTKSEVELKYPSGKIHKDGNTVFNVMMNQVIVFFFVVVVLLFCDSIPNSSD